MVTESEANKAGTSHKGTGQPSSQHYTGEGKLLSSTSTTGKTTYYDYSESERMKAGGATDIQKTQETLKNMSLEERFAYFTSNLSPARREQALATATQKQREAYEWYQKGGMGFSGQEGFVQKGIPIPPEQQYQLEIKPGVFIYGSKQEMDKARNDLYKARTGVNVGQGFTKYEGYGTDPDLRMTSFMNPNEDLWEMQYPPKFESKYSAKIGEKPQLMAFTDEKGKSWEVTHPDVSSPSVGWGAYSDAILNIAGYRPDSAITEKLRAKGYKVPEVPDYIDPWYGLNLLGTQKTTEKKFNLYAPKQGYLKGTNEAFTIGGVDYLAYKLGLEQEKPSPPDKTMWTREGTVIGDIGYDGIRKVTTKWKEPENIKINVPLSEIAIDPFSHQTTKTNANYYTPSFSSTKGTRTDMNILQSPFINSDLSSVALEPFGHKRPTYTTTTSTTPRMNTKTTTSPRMNTKTTTLAMHPILYEKEMDRRFKLSSTYKQAEKEYEEMGWGPKFTLGIATLAGKNRWEYVGSMLAKGARAREETWGKSPYVKGTSFNKPSFFSDWPSPEKYRVEYSAGIKDMWTEATQKKEASWKTVGKLGVDAGFNNVGTDLATIYALMLGLPAGIATLKWAGKTQKAQKLLKLLPASTKMQKKVYEAGVKVGKIGLPLTLGYLEKERLEQSYERRGKAGLFGTTIQDALGILVGSMGWGRGERGLAELQHQKKIMQIYKDEAWQTSKQMYSLTKGDKPWSFNFEKRFDLNAPPHTKNIPTYWRDEVFWQDPRPPKPSSTQLLLTGKSESMALSKWEQLNTYLWQKMPQRGASGMGFAGTYHRVTSPKQINDYILIPYEEEILAEGTIKRQGTKTLVKDPLTGESQWVAPEYKEMWSVKQPKTYNPDPSTHPDLIAGITDWEMRELSKYRGFASKSGPGYFKYTSKSPYGPEWVDLTSIQELGQTKPPSLFSKLYWSKDAKGKWVSSQKGLDVFLGETVPEESLFMQKSVGATKPFKSKVEFESEIAKEFRRWAGLKRDDWVGGHRIAKETAAMLETPTKQVNLRYGIQPIYKEPTYTSISQSYPFGLMYPGGRKKKLKIIEEEGYTSPWLGSTISTSFPSLISTVYNVKEDIKLTQKYVPYIDRKHLYTNIKSPQLIFNTITQQKTKLTPILGTDITPKLNTDLWVVPKLDTAVRQNTDLMVIPKLDVAYIPKREWKRPPPPPDKIWNPWSDPHPPPPPPGVPNLWWPPGFRGGKRRRSRWSRRSQFQRFEWDLGALDKIKKVMF